MTKEIKPIASPITEKGQEVKNTYEELEELRKQLPDWARRVKTAGPDDPIYTSGLHLSMHGSMPQTKTSPKSTDGETPAQAQNSSPTPFDIPSEYYDQMEQEVRDQFSEGPSTEETERSDSSTGPDDQEG